MSDPLALGLRRAKDGRITSHDPDVARVRALVETRMMGEPAGPVKIGRFTLLDRVGEGGMGVVFAAYDAELDRKVAVKLLHGDADDEVVQRRIVREAQAMAKLSHPNVAHVYEVGAHEGRTFIAMEFVRGQTLRAWTREATHTWSEIVAVYIQAGRGLAAAHAAGLVHRDFKPDNAIIDPEGRVRVLDFGLARVEASDPTNGDTTATTTASSRVDSITRTGAVMGTPAYMPPEQIVGGPVSAASDQFAFCVALWEALHGDRPGASSGRVAMLDELALASPNPTRVPAWLRTVVARGLAPASVDRFPTMDALLAALAADPSKRRRRMIAATAVLGTLAAVAAVVVFDRERREQTCVDEAARADALWNDEARGRMREALLGAGASYAASTWANVEPRLDRYAAEWAAIREATCRAATVDRTRSPELASRTTACLTEQSVAFQSFVELMSADDPPLEAAVAGAATLPRLATCANDAALLQRSELPSEPDRRERIAAVDRELTRNAALLSALRFSAGLPRARELVAEAAELDWPPTHARALADLGAFALDARDLTLAESSLTQAAEIALTHGADEIATIAMGRLVSAIAISRTDLDRGLWWGWLAQTVIDRAEELDEVRRIELLHRMGGLYQQRGEHREAAEAFAEAIERGEATFGPDHPHVIDAIDGLAFSRIDLGEVDAAIAALEPAIASLERSLGAEHPRVGELLITLGAAYGRKQDFDAAIAAYERSIAIETAASGADHPRLTDRLTNLGQAYAHAGAHEKAEAAHTRAIAILEASYGVESPKLADAFFARGNYFAGRDDYAHALPDYERAVALKAKTGDPNHLHIGYLLINIAACRHALGDPAGAERDYLRALSIVEPVRGKDDLIVVMLRKDLATALVSTGKPHEGLALAQAVLAQCEHLECPPHKRSDMLMTVAKASWALGQRSEAVAAMRDARAEVDRADVKVNAPEIDAWLAAHAG